MRISWTVKRTAKAEGVICYKCVGAHCRCSAKNNHCMAAQHTQEAEHIEACRGVNAARCVINFMEELGFLLKKPVPLFQDNEACCKLMTERLNASRSKHVLLRYHTVKEHVMKFRTFDTYWCDTHWQLADIFTKCLDKKNFERLDRMVRGIDLVDFEGLCKKIEPGEW